MWLTDMQSTLSLPVALALPNPKSTISSPIAFLPPLSLPALPSPSAALTNWQTEIGIAFTSSGTLFLLSGMLLFFDRALLAMGNILFLIGLTLIIGLQKTLVFFSRRQKLRGTAAFAAGIVLILMRWAFVGFVVELYGIAVLFGDFLGTVAGFAGQVPVVGPYVARALRAVGAQRGNESLPV